MVRTSTRPGTPTQDDYTRLLEFRTALRRFLRVSEQRAHDAGVTPAQHQLLLAIRGHRGPAGPSIGEVADYLLIRHNSAVGLVDRAVAAGLVVRHPDPDHPGTVRLGLTRLGEQKIEALSMLALAELTQQAPTMEAFWRALEEGTPG